MRRVDGDLLRNKMDELGTPEELRGGVVDLIVQLRSVGHPNLLEASVSILSKIRHRIIQSPEEVTDLWSLLSTARLDEITRFLDDPEMPSGALEAMVSARNLANTVAHLSDALQLRKAAGIGYTEAERPMMQKLKAVLNEVDLENESSARTACARRSRSGS